MAFGKCPLMPAHCNGQKRTHRDPHTKWLGMPGMYTCITHCTRNVLETHRTATAGVLHPRSFAMEHRLDTVTLRRLATIVPYLVTL